MIRLSSYLQDEEPFYAHGHPDEICQQKLTGARRASRGRWLFPTRLHTDIQRKMSSGRRCTMPEQSELPQQKGKRVIMKINDRKE